jgi:hypothetical protein
MMVRHPGWGYSVTEITLCALCVSSLFDDIAGRNQSRYIWPFRVRIYGNEYYYQ